MPGYGWPVVDDRLHPWVAPGEIRYCECGYVPIEPSLPSMKCFRCADHEHAAARMVLHAALVEKANAMAEARKQAGIKPLFWMRQQSDGFEAWVDLWCVDKLSQLAGAE